MKMGQARITANTSTGNQDYTYVSVGFYNGIDIKYNAGPSDPNGILGYGELDWSVVKNYGMDFAIIRAGYALNNSPDSDPYFVTNIQNAFAQGLNVMISFDGYATDASYAEKEAEYFLNYINEPSETLPEQPVEEEILPTPVKKAESSIRPIILVFTGVTALIAIAVILVRYFVKDAKLPHWKSAYGLVEQSANTGHPRNSKWEGGTSFPFSQLCRVKIAGVYLTPPDNVI